MRERDESHEGSGGLDEMLRRSARGDEQEFLRFYDATSPTVFTLELARALARGERPGRARAEARRAAAARFVAAWRHAGEQADCGRSPLAWLLSLPVTPAGVASR